MSSRKVHLIAGARPNFMKVAPLWHALRAEAWCEPVLVHTGQHYDDAMSGRFFRDFALPSPDFFLGAGSGSHARQTADVMIAYEQVCFNARPDWVVVVGDVNSTLAATLVAKKLCLPVAHLEAGLRSGDRTMPEEINRLMTDSVSDVLWTPSADADENLRMEGIPTDRIDRVGNIMIDAFEMLRDAIEAVDVKRLCPNPPGSYGVVTIHRPANVDSPETLRAIVDGLLSVQHELPLVFPEHPRTRNALVRDGLRDALERAGVVMLDPLGYLDFMALVRAARVVITDSGGVQEETSYLGIPCFTLRENTERPVTILHGTNRLVRPNTLRDMVLAAPAVTAKPIALWDGHTAARVVDSLHRRAVPRASRRVVP